MFPKLDTLPKDFKIPNKIIIERKSQFLRFRARYKIKDEDGGLVFEVNQVLRPFDRIKLIFMSSLLVGFELQAQNPKFLAKLSRGFTFLYSTVKFKNQIGELVATFVHKFEFMGLKFEILDYLDTKIFSIKSGLNRTQFEIQNSESEKIAKLERNFREVFKNYFDIKSRYVLEFLSPQLKNSNKLILILAAVCVDKTFN